MLSATNPNEKVIVTTQTIPAQIKKTVTTTVKRYYTENSSKTAKSTEIAEEEEQHPQIVQQASVQAAQPQQIFHGTTATQYGPVRSQ